VVGSRSDGGKYLNISPYNYCLNSPVTLRDEVGSEPSKTVEWTNFDAFKYLVDKHFGSNSFIFEQKAAFINFYRKEITEAATRNNINPVLLGSVAFTEYGGKTFEMKAFVLNTREILNQSWLSELFGKWGMDPKVTSFGDLGIQIRTACDYINCEGMTNSQIAGYLKDPKNSFNIAAKYLNELRMNADSYSLEAIQSISNQYNTGQGKQGDGSYGRSILKHLNEISKALKKDGE
jgi:hypothetical protein